MGSLNYLQQQFIRLEYQNLPASLIADIIEVPLAEVEQAIATLPITLRLPSDVVATVNQIASAKKKPVVVNRTSQNKQRAEKRELREKAKLEKENEKRRLDAERLALMNQREQQRQNRRRDREPKFVTKPVDLSEKIAVRINAKTLVFVKPGTDIEKIKKQYSAVKSYD